MLNNKHLVEGVVSKIKAMPNDELQRLMATCRDVEDFGIMKSRIMIIRFSVKKIKLTNEDVLATGCFIYSIQSQVGS